MKISQKPSEQLKQNIKQKYALISKQSGDENAASCCGAGTCSESMDYSVFADDYSHIEGYTADADLGLGCGLPTEFAHIKAGDTVVDLGSGAGNDCFIARQIVGDKGVVIGVDMTEAMIEKAVLNTSKLGFSNVKFLLGEIEAIPLKDAAADVVVSNCVMNLVPDKQQAFNETYRIIKKGGHFSISDVVTSGELPSQLKSAAEMYAGCVSGAIDKNEYLSIIQNAGFQNIVIQKVKKIELPNELLKNHLTTDEINIFKQSSTGIFSITVYAEKL